jgi:hypothetical protein
MGRRPEQGRLGMRWLVGMGSDRSALDWLVGLKG